MTTEPPPTRTVYVYRNRGCGSGCLWGCLIVVLLASLPVILAGGWGAWMWTSGYRHDPALRLAAELVKSDGLAQQVLGTGITVKGVESDSFSWMPGMSRHSYDMQLQGSRAQGDLEITAHADTTGEHLDSAILTGPDGRRYDLLKHAILPGGEPGTDI